jgi:hypothetical protein
MKNLQARISATKPIKKTDNVRISRLGIGFLISDRDIVSTGRTPKHTPPPDEVVSRSKQPALASRAATPNLNATEFLMAH